MQSGRPSETARAMGHMRALWSEREPKLFFDPLAARILCEPVLHRTVLDHRLSPEVAARRGRYVAARSRFARDCVTEGVAADVGQVIILGAGLDTTAYHPAPSHVRFFEVDHPATQLWKRDLLERAEIDVPDRLTFVPVDFDETTLARELAAAGLDRTRAALFIVLGVTVYLTRAAVEEMLGYIADHDRAAIVVDYFPPPQDPVLQARAASTAEVGEPWRSTFLAGEFRELLLSFGYHDIEDFSASEVVAFYDARTRAQGAAPGPRLVRACAAHERSPGLHMAAQR